MKSWLFIVLCSYYVICSDESVTNWNESTKLFIHQYDRILTKRAVNSNNSGNNNNNKLAPNNNNNNNNENNNDDNNNNNIIRNNSAPQLQSRILDVFPNDTDTNVTLYFQRPLNKSDPCIFKVVNDTIHGMLFTNDHYNKSHFNILMNDNMQRYLDLRDSINSSVFNLIYSSMQLQKLLGPNEPLITYDADDDHLTCVLIIVLLSSLIVGFVAFKAFNKYYASSRRTQQHQTLMEDAFYNT